MKIEPSQIDAIAAEARSLMQRGHHWSEAVWLAVGESLLDEFPPMYRRLGAGFAGGLGGTRQEVCGALSGSVLAISALLGRSGLGENDHPARDLSALYWTRFLAQYGDTRCAPLRGRIKAPGGIEPEITSCAILVEKATRLLLEMLDRSPYATEWAAHSLLNR